MPLSTTLRVCALASLLSVFGCRGSECDESRPCAVERVCAGRSAEEARCLRRCGEDGGCPAGTTCGITAYRDCPVCGVPAYACLEQ